MKKLLLIGFITCLSYSLQSQNKIGVFAGATTSTLTDGFFNSFYLGSNSYTFHVGGVYELPLQDNISFRPKVIYNKQGNNESLTDNIQYVTSYINLPLNFKFFKQPYLLAGPQIGFLLNTKKNEFDVGDMKTFDYGVNLGIGWNIKDFFIDFSIYKGFNELIEVNYVNNNPYRDVDMEATNFTALLSFGYHFL
ncbi:porin family protein [Xanthomarina sp. F2636L]|uniref:porin family protein n=1 Tax=Xanthomarina sp. F2636L TaxID=2996018 RepID=UPI00225E2584|nr:porin family protein [Xanthomarina sp. F2636L]MCX7550730.1 porin family protein [Xanthomarina sp. F2636L]